LSIANKQLLPIASYDERKKRLEREKSRERARKRMGEKGRTIEREREFALRTMKELQREKKEGER